MLNSDEIREPFQFNPLKHHLSFIREYVSQRSGSGQKPDLTLLRKEVRRTGTSVMDVYKGRLSVEDILTEVTRFLESEGLTTEKSFSTWAGSKISEFRIVTLSDTSQWTLKYHDDRRRYIHLFPSRMSPHSFRVKANTLQSAILYIILIGRDFITREDLNKARSLPGLSPVRDPAEAEAITGMIEILRD